MKKDISIIIPCYNTNPAYLEEAIESVYASVGKNVYEIIVIDDGSDNRQTLDLLATLGEKNITVLVQQNKGPAAARNTGVKHADADFIFFLDSDNKILPGYIDEGLKTLRENTKACVAYGNPVFIGDSTARNFKTRAFDINSILLENYIDTCSVTRKSAWELVGGMDEASELIGYEDWEFWIHLYKKGCEFIYLDKAMFEYRVEEKSLMGRLPNESFLKAIEYIFKKHWDLIYQQYYHLFGQQVIYQNDQQQPFRSFIKYYGNKFFKK